MVYWDRLMDPAREALEALIAKGDDMADRIEELEARQADLVRAALYKTRGYTWSGVEALIADPEAVAAIVTQVMGKD